MSTGAEGAKGKVVENLSRLDKQTCDPPHLQATVAYLSGHVDQARRLSLEARAHGERMAAADVQAAHSIFQARNANSSGTAVLPGEWRQRGKGWMGG